jgi:Copper amine oxidase N-terminal domain.
MYNIIEDYIILECDAMKKIAVLRILTGAFLILCLILSNIVYAASAPKVVLDGKEISFDVPPVIENGRTLVPMRAIFEALGAELYWNNDTQTASAFKGKIAVAVQVGNYYANKNNSPVKLDVPPKIINNRTLIPLRFVSEALGCDVKWDEETMTVTITSSGSGQTNNKIIGIWADSAYSGSLVNPITGFVVGTAYSGQWYKFNDDGTFTYSIAGSGTIITGLAIVNGKYKIEGNKIIFSDCTETFYKNFSAAEKKDNPTTMDSKQFKYNSEDDTLKIDNELFYRINTDK